MTVYVTVPTLRLSEPCDQLGQVKLGIVIET